MGLIGTFVRFIISVAIFLVILALGIVFGPQLYSALGTLPGTIVIGNVEIPVLASIVASVALSLLLNLVTLPFRRHNEA